MYRILAGLFAVTVILSGGTASSSPTNSNASNPSNVIANVSGSGAFSINGASLANGVPSWPIVAGDQISTGAAPVLITLPDGTELDLEPNSRVTITIQDGMVKVIVNAGGCHQRDHDHHHKWCWIEPASTSPHRCGDGDHDRDDHCCPDSYHHY